MPTGMGQAAATAKAKGNNVSAKTRPDVFIIESLGFADEEHRREGEIISRALRMSGKRPIYHYVRTRRELEHFVAEFDRSGYRYLHISCHGNVGSVSTTLDAIDDRTFGAIVGPALSGRRLFLSTCLAATSKLAQAVFGNGACLSVAGPVGEIAFDDSVILWTTFYHLMFKENASAMRRKNIEINLTKAGLILDQRLRLHTPASGNSSTERVLPPESKFVTDGDVE